MDKAAELLYYGSVFVPNPAQEQALYQSLGAVDGSLPDGRMLQRNEWPAGAIQVWIDDTGSASTTSTPGVGSDG